MEASRERQHIILKPSNDKGFGLFYILGLLSFSHVPHELNGVR